MSPEVAQRVKGYLLGAKALQDAMNRSRSAAPEDSVWKYGGYRQYLLKYNALAPLVAKSILIELPLGTFDEKKVPGIHDTTAFHQQEIFEAVYAELSMLIASLEHAVGLKGDEIQSLRDFFQVNLRRAVFKTPDIEREIQDVLETLLVGRGLTRGVDYNREQGRVAVSIKEVVPDFIIPRLSLAIEVKLSKDRVRSKEIVDEINADIQAYGKKYDALLFLVYDVGSIQDEAAFKLGLEHTENRIHLVVVKH